MSDVKDRWSRNPLWYSQYCPVCGIDVKYFDRETYIIKGKIYHRRCVKKLRGVSK
jgi:hypothetical protein